MSVEPPEAMDTGDSWQKPAQHSALASLGAGASGSGSQRQVMSPSTQSVQGGSDELRNAAALSMMTGPGFVVNNLTQIMMNSEINVALQHLMRVEEQRHEDQTSMIQNGIQGLADEVWKVTQTLSYAVAQISEQAGKNDNEIGQALIGWTQEWEKRLTKWASDI